MSGYSGTPLAQKLGIKPDSRLRVIAAPALYRQRLFPLPAGVTFHARPRRESCDIVHIFVRSLTILEHELPRARAAIKPDGAIWVSWYKKSSGVLCDVTEDEVRARALATDLVDVKVCAVDELWSGLKLVVRKHLRPSPHN